MRNFAILSTFFILVLALQSCNKKQDQENIKKDIGILVASIPKRLDTSKAISYNTVFFTDNLFRRLFRISGNFQYSGDLAESWTLNEKQKIITIKLKQGQKFSNGLEIKADQVVNSFNRILDKKSIPAFFFQNISGLRKINNHMLEVRYKGWHYTAFQVLTSPFWAVYFNGITPKQETPETWITSTNYKITKWNDREFIAQNDKKTVKLIPVTNSDLGGVDIIAPRANWVSEKVATQLTSINKKQWNKYLFDSFNSTIILLNNNIPLAHKKCLSKVFHSKINKSQLLGESANNSLIPKDMMGSLDNKLNQSFVGVETNLKPLKISFTIKRDEVFKELISKFISHTKVCNVFIDQKEMTRKDYLGSIVRKDFDLTIMTISALYNDPFFILSFFHSKSNFNFSGVKNKIIDKKIEQLINSETQKELIDKVNEILGEISNNGYALPVATVDLKLFINKRLSIDNAELFDLVKWDHINVN
ncbi:MAG: ABC transporter substrate-binding protein [Bacteriovoracaceae bacterium]